MRLAPLALSAVLLLPAAVPATTYLIRPDGSGDFPTIQAGLDGSTSQDTLLLADGVFCGPGNRDLSLSMRSSQIFARNADPSRCAIDLAGERLGTNGSSYNEFRDIEIRDGRALGGYMAWTRFDGCLFTRPVSVSSVQEGRLEFADCVILGGVGGSSVLGTAETLVLERCRVEGHGSDRLFSAFRLTATDCIFERNAATDAVLGAAPWMGMAASLEATRCEFYENTAPGGVLSGTDAHQTLEQCTFARNEGPSLRIGSWQPSDVTIRVTGCTMSDNRGPGEILVTPEPGQGVPTLHLERSILAFREAGVAVACVGENQVIEVSCCDVFGNQGGDWVGCIAGHFGQAGNISEDPLFCGDEVPYRLQGGSPCAPGATCEDRIGAWPVGCAAAIPPAGEAAASRIIVAAPNPFFGRVCFRGSADVEAWTIDLYDAAGRRVRALRGAGPLRTWDGRDAGGEPVPAGVYAYRARAAARVQRGHVILVR
jgi:hypothetical protein